MTGGTSLRGKLALVTGATKGLGRAIAAGLARAGCDILVVSRDEAQCGRVAAELAEEFGVRAVGMACHVGRWSSMDELAERVARDYGSLDVLVNNVGMSPTYESLTDVTEALFDKTIAVNLRSTFRLCALFGEQMMRHDGGSIVNLSAVGAMRPDPAALPYSAAKAGVDALTAGFAMALAPRVRVNSIMPGAFRTELADHWPEGMAQKYADRTVAGRLGVPDEVVAAAVHLAGPESSYTTGSVLRVDGGLAL